MSIFIYIETVVGYCSECNSPTMVAVLTLYGWHHRFNVCANCLRKIADVVDKIKIGDLLK